MHELVEERCLDIMHAMTCGDTPAARAGAIELLQLLQPSDDERKPTVSNLNDCYQCGGWMTSDDIQQRDFHGICNKCLEKKSRELDAAYARNGGDTMQIPNRDYPAENDGDETIWVQQDGEWKRITTDPIAFTHALSIGTEEYWQDIDGEWYPINETSPEWVLAAYKRLEETR